MTQGLIEASVDASGMARQPVARPFGARLSARGLLTTAQHTLTVFGISAVALIALLLARPDLAMHMSKILVGQPALPAAPTVEAPPLSALMQAPAPAPAATNAAPLTKEEKALIGTQKQQQWVTSWLSKRYRVAGDAANMLVSTAYLTAREIKLDPLLILAVMAIESGLNPFAESPMGAQGLMQVMSKIHHEKFQDLGGLQAALNPVANIRVGSLILKDYVTRGGSVEAGLKTYVGAAAFDTDSGYGSRVLAEYRRLKQVSAGKVVPISNPVMASAPAPTQNQSLNQNNLSKETAPASIKLDKPDEIAGL